jgi:hypothetical protein
MGRAPEFAILAIQEEFDFSEGTSAHWIFDVDIDKMKAEVFCTY